MPSINKKLCNYLSIAVSELFVLILFSTDIIIDYWLRKEFDISIITKSSLLTTLVSEQNKIIDFDFADEFMPEFSGKNNPEYFHLWYDKITYERSKTLDLFDIKELPAIETNINQSKIVDITLPDGRPGRMVTIDFHPQVDSEIRQKSVTYKDEYLENKKVLKLAFAISKEDLNQKLWFVDLMFILASFFSLIITRIMVKKIVNRGLQPLEILNKKINNLSLSSDKTLLITNNLPIELIPTYESFNQFITNNKELYFKEKRITSDLAHELKTPITELITLTEVAIKFPHDKTILKSFTNEALEIATRLNKIVNDILLLHKSSQITESMKEDINITSLINSVIFRENRNNRDISAIIDDGIDTVFSNEFSLDIILTNLISNALYYSPEDSKVSITASFDKDTDRIKIKIANSSTYLYLPSDLDHFFEPLWQKDNSRTSSERYGLGLAIVKSYSENINASISVNINSNNFIVFTLII